MSATADSRRCLLCSTLVLYQRLQLPAYQGACAGVCSTKHIAIQPQTAPPTVTDHTSLPGLDLCHVPTTCCRHALPCRRAVAEHKPKIVFLTSPNNPDGSVISEQDLLEVLALPVLVVLDEAYIEFCTDVPSRLKWVQQYNNLVVLRTFSKCAALAGMRVGYGAFPLGMIEYLWRAKQPYNVSVAAEVGGTRFLWVFARMLDQRGSADLSRSRVTAAAATAPAKELGCAEKYGDMPRMCSTAVHPALQFLAVPFQCAFYKVWMLIIVDVLYALCRTGRCVCSPDQPALHQSSA